MSLNEKSAKCMGWILQRGDSGGTSIEMPMEYVDSDGNHMYFHHEVRHYEDSEVWNPEKDYNQAIKFFKKARSINPQETRDNISLAIYELSKTMGDAPCELDLSPAQITEACCKAIEEE